MRKLCISLFLLFTCRAFAVAQDTHRYNTYVDVQHYGFSIEVNDGNDEIKAAAEITFLVLRTTTTITFDLTGKNDTQKGMTVSAVKENEASLLFDHSADQLKIKFSAPLKPGETRTCKITYSGIPTDGLVFSKNKFQQRTIFGDNWPNRAHNWLPCVDHLSDKASVDFMITAPDHYQVISNGVLIEESAMEDHRKFTHWKETVLLPTKVMVIGLADFAVGYEGNVDCIPVSSWVFPQDKKNGFYDYGQAMDILPFFIRQVGPYAYKKLANVEAITIFGGMENASAIFYNEQSINGKRGSEELLAHEIAHQWFGNSATESDWCHVWLSEGFATEMANLYMESKYGAAFRKAALNNDRKTIFQFEKSRFTPIVDSSEKTNYLELLNTNSYKKGGWVLHMLRTKLGDSLFWKGIQTYYARYAGKNAATDDIRNVMEEVSGIDLKDFFQQWLYGPGHPQLLVTWKYDDNKKLLILTVTQLQKNLFSFPVEFSFTTTGPQKNSNYIASVKDKITRIEIPLRVKPERVIADPEINLLFEASIAAENK